MANHLLVIGQRLVASPHSDSDMNQVSAVATSTDSFHVERCNDPAHLPELVQSVARRSGEIDLLDLYDHGDVGQIRMGRDILFRSDALPGSELFGRAIAIELRPFLRDTAHVRLLGCKTAATTDSVTSAPALSGRLLLLKLARALGGHRTVFGTITSIQRGDFSKFGFRRDREEMCLFSSLAALDGPSPSYQDRGRHVDAARPDAVSA